MARSGDRAVSFEFSGSPVAKGRARFVRATGIAFTPAKTRSYEAALKFAAQEAMNGQVPLDGPLTVYVTAHLPIPKSWSQKKQKLALHGLIRPISRPDVDNYAKSAADAMNEIVFKDDAQIVSLTVAKWYDDRPRLEIQVIPMTIGIVAGGQHEPSGEQHGNLA